MKVAALYVETGGAYFGLPDVDPWDEARDARLYAGPWPVVAHPPCNRWSVLASCRPEYTIGDDGGTFAHALTSVRRFGGVLEHPEHTRAWRAYGLMPPPAYGWARSLDDAGWVCRVDQRLYGLAFRKPTWLYVHGVADPPPMRWGRSASGGVSVERMFGGGRQHLRARTPPLFRAALLDIARSTQPSFDVLPPPTRYTHFPEPPRDSGEADAVNGLTALRTHHGPATAGSSNAPRRLKATGSRAGDNTHARSNAGHDARS